MPCYAVAYVLQETRLISLLLAEWIKKAQIHCVVVVVFFPPPHSVYASPFHVVICTKGRIEASAASFFQIGIKEGWRGRDDELVLEDRGRAGVGHAGFKLWSSRVD